MKITNVEVIKFRVTDEYYRKHHRWGYGCPPEDRKVGGDTPLDDLEYTVGAGINGIQTITKISTDEGLFGFGETDTNPWATKALLDSPGTHAMGRGFNDILIGKDPTNVEGLWHEMNEKTMMTSRRGLGICAMGAIDMALWDLCG